MKIDVETLAHGQQRSYGPHIYSAIITITDGCLLEWQVKEIAHVVVHPFTEEKSDGSMSSHFQPRLREFAERGEGVWEVLIEEPYCD